MEEAATAQDTKLTAKAQIGAMLFDANKLPLDSIFIICKWGKNNSTHLI